MLIAMAFGCLGSLVAALCHVEMKQEHATRIALRCWDAAMAAAVVVPTVVMLAFGR